MQVETVRDRRLLRPTYPSPTLASVRTRTSVMAAIDSCGRRGTEMDAQSADNAKQIVTAASFDSSKPKRAAAVIAAEVGIREIGKQRGLRQESAAAAGAASARLKSRSME